MKVVINACFGGFSLSRKAVVRMAELQGRPCHFFDLDASGTRRYIPSSVNGPENFFFAFDIPNPEEVIGDGRTSERSALYKKHKIEDREIPRDSALLIKTVEELGDAASGRFADLKVIEIPDGVEYEIDEYDGREHVAEKHRTWS